MSNQLHCCLLVMKHRAVMLGKIAVARGTVKLSPGAATGMTIGPQVVQPQPAAIVTSGMGTKVHRGVHGTGTSVRWGHGIGRHKERWFEMRGISNHPLLCRP